MPETPAILQPMRRLVVTLLLITAANTHAQSKSDALAPLDFLLGTWSAKANAPAGSAGASVTGTYTFRRDLAGHVIARVSSSDSCKGPQDFDCNHHDQLTIFPNPEGAGLVALYLDSEGHVIHYKLSTPDAHTVIFASEGPAAAPHFQLVYHLDGATMNGKFQGAPPGSSDFHSYLEWSGQKQ